MAVSSQKRLSLDTNVLFDLAEKKDFAHAFREAFQARGYSLFIPPTVAAELYFALEHGDRREESLCRTVLDRLEEWDIRVAAITDNQSHSALTLSRRFLHFQLLPRTELHDAQILAETSVLEIPVLVSSDCHILDIDPELLRSLCIDAGFSPVAPASPIGLLRALR